jgi:hypothetical protein
MPVETAAQGRVFADTQCSSRGHPVGVFTTIFIVVTVAVFVVSFGLPPHDHHGKRLR